MEIEILRGNGKVLENSYVLIRLYESREALIDPDNHKDKIVNCCFSFNFLDFKPGDEDNIIDKLLSNIEASVNACIRKVEKDEK